MRFYILVIALIVLGCNADQQMGSQKKPEAKNEDCFLYPSIVDSLKIEDLYDSARLYVYTWHCDDVYMPKSDTAKSITYGELPLQFDTLTLQHDTLNMKFNFIDSSQPILPSMTRNYFELTTGVGFNLKTKRKIYMSSPNGFSTSIKGGDNRYENPLQDKVLAYIRNSWSKLNPCFRKLVEQKKIAQ